MFSMQRLLGKEATFFDLLEASAQEARRSVQALQQFSHTPESARTLEAFVLTRRKEKAINNQISETLCRTFVTALEREDIEALSTALYKIPKTVEKIAERVLISPELVRGISFDKPFAMLDRATETVGDMLKCLRRGSKLEDVKDHNARLQYLEGEMDKLLLDMLKELYSGKMEVNRVIYLKDLFELIEKVTDRCRDAGNVISHVVLKNS